MEPKEVVQRGYELFGEGNMEAFFNEVLHDDVTWIFPGDKHPMSGVFKGKEQMMGNMSKVPELFNNFSVKIDSMISEGNKVFVNVKATADGMDTIFGHYFEILDGKMHKFIAYDDTLSSFNALKQ